MPLPSDKIEETRKKPQLKVKQSLDQISPNDFPKILLLSNSFDLHLKKMTISAINNVITNIDYNSKSSMEILVELEKPCMVTDSLGGLHTVFIPDLFPDTFCDSVFEVCIMCNAIFTLNRHLNTMTISNVQVMALDVVILEFIVTHHQGQLPLLILCFVYLILNIYFHYTSNWGKLLML